MIFTLVLATVFMSGAHAATRPEQIVRRFCKRYVTNPPAPLLEGKSDAGLESLLSPRLRRKIAGLRACQRDFLSRVPKGAIMKPPYVDCCLFSGTAEGGPNHFAVGNTKNLPDGRVEVLVNLTLQRPGEVYRWQDAYIVARLGNQWLIDDFVAFTDSAGHHVSLIDNFSECRSGKLTGW
ncbi:MAG: hypothetical protein ACJ76N_13065 [Thermoanaerobaculia bacterium]